MTPSSRTVHRSCNLCEASCGLAIEVADNAGAVDPRRRARPVLARLRVPEGDRAAGPADRPRPAPRPLAEPPTARWQEIGWDEALDLVADRLTEIRDRDGGDAVALYLGNPITHGWAPVTLIPAAHRRARDPQPVQRGQRRPAAAAPARVPAVRDPAAAPGAGPRPHRPPARASAATRSVSNGSIMTAPDMRGRLAALRERGGRVVVIDPRRSETARRRRRARLPVRPGHRCVAARRDGARDHFRGRWPARAARRTSSTGSRRCGRGGGADAGGGRRSRGVPAETIRRLARELAAARRGCGRTAGSASRSRCTARRRTGWCTASTC